MEEVFAASFAFADVFTFLVLSAAGLAIIFGMMGIINLAHGEFIMCGAYVTATMVHLGVPLVLAQLCGAVAAGVIGIVLERTVVHRLYNRPLDSIPELAPLPTLAAISLLAWPAWRGLPIRT